jgi:hypothetical protein
VAGCGAASFIPELALECAPWRFQRFFKLHSLMTEGVVLLNLLAPKKAMTHHAMRQHVK